MGEYNTSNVLLRRYVQGPGMDAPLVRYDGTGTSNKRWLLADERGSIIAETNGSGGVSQINSYDDYGLPASGNVGRFGYTGQLWLGEIGLYSYKNRMYHPGLARFLQPDPIGLEGGMNLYAYVGGDPVNLLDPWGLSADPLIRQPHEEYKDQGCPFSMHCRDDHLLQWIASGEALIFFTASMGMPPAHAIIAAAIMQLRTVYQMVGEPHVFAAFSIGICSPDVAFQMVRMPLISAPGAPFAEQGAHNRNLWGGNPIRQVVDLDNRTLTNITRPGHRYFPGFVRFDVLRGPLGTSIIGVTGIGIGRHGTENVIIGSDYFSKAARAAAIMCSLYTLSARRGPGR